jgi:poly(3-hydroxybutyrate) depolymerase
MARCELETTTNHGANSSPFEQREFTLPASPASYSLAETGYAYLPASCAALEPCRVHVALHGCKQNYDAIGDRYIQHAGYNEWADTNHLIILYPQTIAGDPVTNFGTPLNPYGCWD